MHSDEIGQPYRQFEHSGWERAASSYAGTFEAVSTLFVPPLLDAVDLFPGCKLLDAACGPGLIASLAASRGSEVMGVDFSANMIAEAKKRNPSLSFKEADAEALPFRDGVFDIVVIGFGLHHFPFPARAISEAHRVLRVGGRVGFTTWAPPEEHVMHRIVVGAIREVGDTAAALPIAPGGAVNDLSVCAGLLKAAGFDAATVSTEIIKTHVRIDSARHLMDMLIAGTVRLSTTLRAQPKEKTAAIRAAIDREMSPYRHGDHFRFPVAAILAVAVK